ncbi:DUF6383 domain-containing protein [Parabacteroides sp.]
MNKKFFTLLAASCAAMAVNAQTIYYGADGKVMNWSTDGGITDAANANSLFPTGASNTVDSRFSFMPFGAVTVPVAAQAITKLDNVGKGAESRLFQFKTDDDKLLAMQWNPKDNKYQLVLVDPTAQGTGSVAANYFIDETLWEVRAEMVNESKALRYTLINKQAQLPLQLSAPAKNGLTNVSSKALVTGSSITWTWSEVAEKTGGLTGELTAAVDNQYSIGLTLNTGGSAVADGSIQVIKFDRADKTTDLGGASLLSFTAYEATPVVLKAEQINSMMTGTKGTKVQFSMTPEIAPNVANNPLTNGKFQAFNVVSNMNGLDATFNVHKDDVFGYESDQTNNYVVLAKEGNTKNLLRVDTVYHNKDLDGRYELKLNTTEIEAPREAYVLGATVPTIKDKNNKAIANEVISQLFNQAQFRFNYYPSSQSVLIQAKQYLYLDKEAKQSWWKTLLHAELARLTTAQSAGSEIQGLTDAEWKNFMPATASTDNAYYPYTIDGKSTLFDLKAAPVSLATEAAALKDFLSGANRTRATYFMEVTTSGASDIDTDAAAWKSGLIRLTTLTSGANEHSEVTMGYDERDGNLGADGFKGIKTLIRIGETFVTEEAADIDAGFYYVQNGNKVSTDLLKSGYWRYQDLAATNRTETSYDQRAGKWIIGSNNTADYETPNMVYSAEKLTNIPSAQWYFAGTSGAGFYTIKNRESKDWMQGTTSSVYLWKVKENGVVVPNTYAMKGTVDPTKNDTIVIAQAAIDPMDGYMNISKEVANADTTVFNFKFSVLGSDPVMVGEKNGVLTVLNGTDVSFKVERAQMTDVDKYTTEDVVYADDLIYGMATSKKDTLRRALYYIYKEDVSANTSEQTGKRTREYLTLDGGEYKLVSYVVSVEDGFTVYSKDDNNGKEDNRKKFYIKNVTNTPNEFALVDPFTTNTADQKIGVRAFVNQNTGILQPAGLKSQGASNVYDNSLFTFEKLTRYNYRDVRGEGKVGTDTLVFHKDGNNEIKLYEASVKGANIGLLARDNKAQYTKNFALFVDTATVQYKDMPIFLLGVRPSEKWETGSSIASHNRLISTTADYLMVLTDSAAVNPAYKDIKGNIRLGFVKATHHAEANTLELADGSQTIDLTKKALTPATFAFRYADKNSDKFYIETADVDGAPAWVKVINEVPVIVKDIKEAEIYNVAATDENPTANDNVAVSNVVVEATTGAVIVKNAAGLKVTVSNLLGQPVASEVLSSDNATIAAPAGIVVVAVEGADAVKAIVK